MIDILRIVTYAELVGLAVWLVAWVCKGLR
jgi:hypothetical protein